MMFEQPAPKKQCYLFNRLEKIDSLEKLKSLADELMIAQTIGEALHLADTPVRKEAWNEL